MGQSQSNTNRQLQENDMKIQKLKTLTNSADPRDRKMLERMETDLREIVSEITTEILKENKKMQNVGMASNAKKRFLEGRRKRIETALEEKANRNKELAKNLK